MGCHGPRMTGATPQGGARRNDEATLEVDARFRPRMVPEVIPPETEIIATKVLDAAFRVHRALGAGFKESVYQRCLAHALCLDGVRISQSTPLRVEFEGLVIDDAGQPDFVVEDLIVVELKASDGFHAIQAAQVINYLKASGLSLGLLINFNVPLLRDGIRRYIHPDLVRARIHRSE